jgi:hypothetical protein
MDTNLGNPTGYIKVEMNGQTAKLQISLNNLSDRPGIKYQIYGIRKEEQKFDYTAICDFQITNGRADIKLNRDSSDIDSNQLSFDDINIFAVIARLPDAYASVICPLVAYKSGEHKWKGEFEAALRQYARNTGTIKAAGIKESEIKEFEKKEAEIRDTGIKADVVKVESRMEFNAPEPVRYNGNVNVSAGETAQSLLSEQILEREDVEEETVGDLSDLIEISDEVFDNTANKTFNNVAADFGVEHTELREQSNTALNTPEREMPEPGSLNSEATQKPGLDLFSQADNNLNIDMRDITSKFESTLTSLYNREHESQALNDCHMGILSAVKAPLTAENTALAADSDTLSSENDIIGSAERNFREISEINTEGDKVRTELDIESLREELDKSFETCNPFNNKSRRFKWWKINSPGYLNNILFRNNVKTYLLFNPKVMMAHYKYRYIIFGIRFDKYTGRERFVCGVPGVYSIDENPFGNMGSWAQLEGYKPKYGAFGYWIILIDPRTGKLLKIK